MAWEWPVNPTIWPVNKMEWPVNPTIWPVNKMNGL